jgi:hypothetical protein
MGNGKGIEWLINLDAKTSGATDVIEALGKTRTAADAAGAAIDRALSKMEKLPKSMGDAGWSKGLNNLKQIAHGAQLTDREFAAVKARTAQLEAGLEHMGTAGTEKVGGLWKEVFKGEFALEVVKKSAELAWEGVKKVGEGIWEALQLAGRSERTGHVFANMLGEKEGAETLEYLKKFSEMSEFTDDALKGMGTELLRAGLRGADFRNALGAVVDIAAQAPDKMAGASEAVASLSRIALTGRVDARTLYGLRLDPHAVADQLAKDLGKTPDVIKKQLKDGTLKGADAMSSIFTVIEQKTGKQLGALGEGMADGFTARLEKLKDIPEEIGKQLKTTQGFQDISDTIARITKVFDPESSTGEKFFKALSGLIDKLGSVLKGIDWEKVAAGIGKVVDQLTEMVDPLVKLVGVLDKVNTATSWITSPTQAAKDLRHWMNEGKKSGGKEIADGMAAGMTAGKPVVMDASVDLAAVAAETTRKKLDIQSPSGVYEDIGNNVAEGMALGMERGQERVAGAAKSMVGTPSIGSLDGAGQGSQFNAGGINVAVHVHVGGANASAEDIAREVATVAPEALLSALEQFNLQAGVA